MGTTRNELLKMNERTGGDIAYIAGMSVGGAFKLAAIIFIFATAPTHITEGHRLGILFGGMLAGLWIITLTQLFFCRRTTKGFVLAILLLVVVVPLSVYGITAIVDMWDYVFVPTTTAPLTP